jgi:hypothetical protein
LEISDSSPAGSAAPMRIRSILVVDDDPDTLKIKEVENRLALRSFIGNRVA